MPHPPAPQDKCGTKFDHVAKRLALALAPLGFQRKGRQLAAPGGVGDGMEGLAAHVNRVDETQSQFRERLGQLQAALPPEHACARPAHSDETKFNAGTDMAVLARLGGASHQGVAQRARERGAPKQIKQAVERALKEPLTNPRAPSPTPAPRR